MAKASVLRSHDAANGTNHGLFILSLIFLFRRHLKAWSYQSRVDQPPPPPPPPSPTAFLLTVYSALIISYVWKGRLRCLRF